MSIVPTFNPIWVAKKKPKQKKILIAILGVSQT